MAHYDHKYHVTVEWTGNKGKGTSSHEYSPDYTIQASGKPSILGSTAPAFRGDEHRWNPEELLIASASSCHKLWYLRLCADAGITVLAYVDEAEGSMTVGEKGRFSQIILHPRVTIRPGDDTEHAKRLHQTAHEKCFIANSLNFPVLCEPSVEMAELLSSATA